MKISNYLVGIDEAGRGPLAGPLVFGLVAVRESDYHLLKKEILAFDILLNDSKKLSPKARSLWRKFLYEKKTENKLIFAHCSISAGRIDSMGLTESSKFCINCLLSRLNFTSAKTKVLLDGGLKAPEKFVLQETIIKGDEKEPLISLASILAKTTRDMKLLNLAKKFPQYGFEKHKGYGTKDHREKIFCFGPCSEHRQSFIKNLK